MLPLLPRHCIGPHARPLFHQLRRSGSIQVSSPPMQLTRFLQADRPPDPRQDAAQAQTHQHNPILGQGWIHVPVLQRFAGSTLLRQLAEETGSLSVSLNWKPVGLGARGAAMLQSASEGLEDSGSSRTSLETEINQLSRLSAPSTAPLWRKAVWIGFSITYNRATLTWYLVFTL